MLINDSVKIFYTDSAKPLKLKTTIYDDPIV